MTLIPLPPPTYHPATQRRAGASPPSPSRASTRLTAPPCAAVPPRASKLRAPTAQKHSRPPPATARPRASKLRAPTTQKHAVPLPRAVPSKICAKIRRPEAPTGPVHRAVPLSAAPSPSSIRALRPALTLIDHLVDDFVENFREEELEQVIFSALNDEDAKTEENDAIREIIMQLYSTDEIPIRHLSSRMPKLTSTEPILPSVMKPSELDLKEVGFGCHFEDSGEFGVKSDTLRSVVESTEILEIDVGFDLVKISPIVSLSIPPPPKPTPAISTRISHPETPPPPRPPPEPPPQPHTSSLHLQPAPTAALQFHNPTPLCSSHHIFSSASGNHHRQPPLPPSISTRISPPETPPPPRPPPEPPPSALCRHLHKAACTVMSFPCV
ncbi:formin-like protein 5 [Salvia miltiorrhiza]|uniref:formin-like protein 5 n=1 Tax=Salvia miltiorrhiza TaxID=226208 RepID=UPI0025AC232F|nr:formin-like protein 5 [Salvia miltiorrhiza]